MGNDRKTTILSAGGSSKQAFKALATTIVQAQSLEGNSCALWEIDDADIQPCHQRQLCEIAEAGRCGLNDTGRLIMRDYFESDTVYLLLLVEDSKKLAFSDTSALNRILFRLAYSQRHVDGLAPYVPLRVGGPHLHVVGALPAHDRIAEKTFEIEMRKQLAELRPITIAVEFAVAA